MILLIAWSTTSRIIILLLHVDVMIITGYDAVGILELKSYLHWQFEMNTHLFSWDCRQSWSWLLVPTKYAWNLFSQAQLIDSKVALMPLLEDDTKHTIVDSTLLENRTLYYQLMRSLVYLTVTQLDITFAVHIVSQFMAAPWTSHLAAVLCILRYVKETISRTHISLSGPPYNYVYTMMQIRLLVR